MKSLTIGMMTFFVGLICYTAIMIASNLYHQWKKKNSFRILENTDQVIVIRNPFTNAINSAAHFFLYSLATIITVLNKNENTVFIQLSVLYTICLIVVLFEYYYGASFKVVINKVSRTISLNNEQYSLKEVELEISDRSFYLTDDYDSYGLYLKKANGRRKRLYGYSTLWDIQELKSQLELRLNIHQHELNAIQTLNSNSAR